MPRKQKKYHYIYKTTCQITGRFYVGMHSTDDLQDGYLGSGKILGYSIGKHGRENHRLEILEFLPDRNALKAREKEVVNEQLLADPLNINLKYGGEGGSHGKEKLIWSRPEVREKHRANLKIAQSRPEYKEAISIAVSARNKAMHAAGKIKYNTTAATLAAQTPSAKAKRRATWAAKKKLKEINADR